MTRMWRMLVVILLVSAIALSACAAPPPPSAAPAAGGDAAPAAEEAAPAGGGSLDIMAPASPGGGWDSTARALATAITAATGDNVTVYNVPGAGGTIGLAQFVSDQSGNVNQLMIGGMVMVGAILTNQAPVGLDQVTPLASLTTEWEAIVVPADSPFQTFDDLLAAFVADPTSISWGGGSAGGTDHMLVGLIAKAAGVPAGSINYIAFSGGGEATAAILSGAVSAGVSGISEFADQVEAGTMRLVAVSSDARIDGVDAPTIAESGLDVVFANWRAIYAAGGITDEELAGLVATIQAAHASDEWQQALAANGWTDFLQTGDEFASFLDAEKGRIEGVLRDIGLVQ